MLLLPKRGERSLSYSFPNSQPTFKAKITHKRKPNFFSYTSSPPHIPFKILKKRKKNMKSILYPQSNYGLPLCVSGITHRLVLSMEMADHDRRREAMKRQRSQARERFHANLERDCESILEEVKEVEVAEDLDSLSYMGCTAKAA